jgi:hypothetical protein
VTDSHTNKKARAIAGLAALTELIGLIGKDGKTDHDLAKVVVDHELELRALASTFIDECM